MGQEIEAAVAALQAVVADHSGQIKAQGQAMDVVNKIVAEQAREIAELQFSLREMRNGAIRAAIDRGVPTRIVAQAHNLSSARVSQIAPRKRPPLC